MNRRDARIFMDYAVAIYYNREARVVAMIAEREEVSVPRIYQILDKVKRRIDWRPSMHPSQAGAKIRAAWAGHHHSLVFEDSDTTPQDMYYVIEAERRRDRNRWYYGE